MEKLVELWDAAEITGKVDHNKLVELSQKISPKLNNGQDKNSVILNVLNEESPSLALAYQSLVDEKKAEEKKKKEILNGFETKMPFSVNALQVVSKRYLVRDNDGNIVESPEKMVDRVATAISEVDRKYNVSSENISTFKSKLHKALANFEFTPAGRTVANAGGPTKVVANCIVLNIQDSMDSIFQTLKDASVLQQAGSGLGFPLHLMRPTGYRTISSRGTSSGPVSFLQVYNSAFGVIKQQNRHGANMAVMRVDHPDILEFIHCKEKEGAIKNFNVSVGLTDEFMQKVHENSPEPYLCEWKGQKMKPRRIKRGHSFTSFELEEVNLTAKELFQEIIECAWNNGEPGCVFIDKVNNTNPIPGLGRIEACNPCVTSDSLISTEEGLITIKELVDRPIKIEIDNRIPTQIFHENGLISLIYRSQKSDSSFSEITGSWKTGIKDVFKITTKSGYEIEATEDHKIMTKDGLIPVRDIQSSHEVMISKSKGAFSKSYNLKFPVVNSITGKNGHKYSYNFPNLWSKNLGQILGWLVGDGWLRDKKGESRVGFVFGKDDFEVLSCLKPKINQFYGREINEVKRENGVFHLSYGSRLFVNYLKSLGVKVSSKAENKDVPNAIYTAPKESVIGFLQGLFSADGTVRKNPKPNSEWIALSSKSLKLLKGVQILLLILGIKSSIFNRSRPFRNSTFRYVKNDGTLMEYSTDGKLFELGVFGENRDFFINEVGFLQNKKQRTAKSITFNRFYKNEFYDRVKSISYSGKKEVYDLTENSTHTMIVNGIVTAQCGEQFLHDGDVCNLGSINLEKFVKFQDGKAVVDYEKLVDVTKTAVRALDNVVDISDFPAEKVNQTSKNNRRIGLGIMGFADMLYQLEIGYNSEEGREVASSVMKCINESAHQMSYELGKEKGIFPNWDKSIYKEKNIVMRNAALTNIAPTGTISMMFDCSGGVEPYFALAYRYKGILGGKTELSYVNKHLKKALIDRGIYSKELMEKIISSGSLQNLDVPEDIKKVFVTSMDISAEDHIKMQAEFQKHCDNAISKTINFKNSATKEDVLNGYILAWKLGCKGCTVYRDGSRDLQVLNLEEKKNMPKSKLEIMKEGKCPECEGKVTVGEGCFTCQSCGFSLCSL